MARYVSRAQKKFNGDGMSFAIAIDDVLDALASGFAMSESMSDPRYIDLVVDEAFERTDETFNKAAAAYAQTGAIDHMYEWGTVGINKGRSNIRPDPMSPAARLWTNFSEGKGLNRTVWYAYRPSVANVPKPTSKETGMSSEVIAKMRDHVFRWKAEVMEEGQDVTIAPRKAKFLLIPAYEENRIYMRPNDIKRGYMLTKKPIYARPGAAAFSGQFTKYWLGFWNGTGEEVLTNWVNDYILSDFQGEFALNRTSNSVRPIGSFSVKTEVAKKTKASKKRVAAKAKARRVSR